MMLSLLLSFLTVVLCSFKLDQFRSTLEKCEANLLSPFNRRSVDSFDSKPVRRKLMHAEHYRRWSDLFFGSSFELIEDPAFVERKMHKDMLYFPFKGDGCISVPLFYAHGTELLKLRLKITVSSALKLIMRPSTSLKFHKQSDHVDKAAISATIHNIIYSRKIQEFACRALHVEMNMPLVLESAFINKKDAEIMWFEMLKYMMHYANNLEVALRTVFPGVEIWYVRYTGNLVTHYPNKIAADLPVSISAEKWPFAGTFLPYNSLPLCANLKTKKIFFLDKLKKFNFEPNVILRFTEPNFKHLCILSTALFLARRVNSLSFQNFYDRVSDFEKMSLPEYHP